jgi:hypothetical protein
MICPACGAEARRSHSRGIAEKLFRYSSGYRIYRCKKCQWRGWASQGRRADIVRPVRTYVYFIVVLVITTMLALYYASRVSEPGPMLPVQ